MSRVGTFSSSQIYRLCSFGPGKKTVDNIGKAFESYVKEVNYENQLGVSVSKEINSKSLTWGNLLEKFVYYVKLKDTNALLYGENRLVHKNIKQWTGIPDFLIDGKVTELKCPYSISSGLIPRLESYNSKDTEIFKKLMPNDYWQLISNSILAESKYVTAMCYIPYQKDLNNIREFASEKIDEEQKTNLFFLEWSKDSELPHISNESQIKDLNKFTFEAPEEDKNFLIDRVNKAIKILK